MSRPRSALRRSALISVALLALAPSVAAGEPGEDEPTAPPSATNPGSVGSDNESVPTENLLTPEQLANLARFQSSLEKRDRAAANVEDALEAANLAAAVAAEAEVRAEELRSVSASAEIVAARAEVEAARMRSVVEGFAYELAMQGDASSSAVVGLVVSGEPPAEVLARSEASASTAGFISSSLVRLVVLNAQAVVAADAAGEARVGAEAASVRAADEARAAGELLARARQLFRKRQAEVADLLLVDPAAALLTSADGGGCASAEAVQGFANGMLPPAVLCPLRSAPGHMLRADAAEAFDAMSRAYAESTGEPLCITDSYRTFEAQVALKAQKPYLAAVPGTSNHGWAVAVDMCGGIENFGTPAHNWMRANAGLFGWVHPSWAQADGSKPEPWHWEFSSELAEQMRALLGQKPSKQRDEKRAGTRAAPGN